MNAALVATSVQENASKLFSVTYVQISTVSFWLPCRMTRPSRCSRSAGRQGTSTWCSATARDWMLAPVPNFAVDPMSTDTRPSRQAAAGGGLVDAEDLADQGGGPPSIGGYGQADEPGIEGGLAAVAGDGEHVVVLGADGAGLDGGDPGVQVLGVAGLLLYTS